MAADGVHYFTSQGNSGQQQGWESPVRLVPASEGLPGTNLDFSTVDPSLYDGGLQDMDPGPGIDVAQIADHRRPAASWTSSGTTRWT